MTVRVGVAVSATRAVPAVSAAGTLSVARAVPSAGTVSASRSLSALRVMSVAAWTMSAR